MKKITKTALACAMLLTCACTNSQKENELTLLIGTYTNTGSKGIYTYRLNTETLQETLLAETETDNPSFLAVSKDHKKVYSVSEGKETSFVHAFDFNKNSGELTFLNKAAVGKGSCHVLLNEEAGFVSSASYSGGSISVCPLMKDGMVRMSGEQYQYAGSGPDSIRQKSSYLHCTQASPDGKMLFATDLGGDAIYQYHILQGDNKKLKSEGPIFVSPGSGPRHLTFNKKGNKAYLINELSGFVDVFEYNEKSGLKKVQSILADTAHGRCSADIHLSPDNRFLYVSTRLKGDGIHIFSVGKDGLLTRVGYHATAKVPRNFSISPDGKLMFVACMKDECIQIFRIDPKNGQLTDTHKRFSVKRPVFVKALK